MTRDAFIQDFVDRAPKHRDRAEMDALFDYIDAHPYAGRGKIMDALGLPQKTVRKAIRAYHDWKSDQQPLASPVFDWECYPATDKPFNFGNSNDVDDGEAESTDQGAKRGIDVQDAPLGAFVNVPFDNSNRALTAWAEVAALFETMLNQHKTQLTATDHQPVAPASSEIERDVNDVSQPPKTPTLTTTSTSNPFVSIRQELEATTTHDSWAWFDHIPEGYKAILDDCTTMPRSVADQYRATPLIDGVTNADAHSSRVDALWNGVIAKQIDYYDHISRKQSQTITLNTDRPIAIAYLSDLHLGSAGTDYISVKRDAELVRDTDGMYAVFHGDGMDNWIVGKLQGLQRNQVVQYDDEWRLFASWIGILSPKLLAVVSGNHELWSYKIAHLDIVRDALKGVRCLYDKHQVVFDLHLNKTRIRHIVRHKWRYNSIYNPTHGLEVAWDRGDIDYDVAIGGHTHIGTFFREFVRHNKKRLAVLTGTYKLVDTFARELGFARPYGKGAGAIIYFPDGKLFHVDDIATAAALLKSLRKDADHA